MKQFLITEGMMESAYDYLRQTPPYCYRPYRLPEGEQVTFSVLGHDKWHGECGYEKGHLFIKLSAKLIGSTASLHYVMGHEMLHGIQWVYPRFKIGNAQHDPWWHRRADTACEFHVWDRNSF